MSEARGIIHGRPKLLTAANTAYTVYTVSAGRKFRLTSLIATNTSGDAILDIYDAASGGPQAFGVSGEPMLKVVVPAQQTIVLDKDVLEPMELDFLSAVVIFSTVSGVWVRVGGYEH